MLSGTLWRWTICLGTAQTPSEAADVELGVLKWVGNHLELELLMVETPPGFRELNPGSLQELEQGLTTEPSLPTP